MAAQNTYKTTKKVLPSKKKKTFSQLSSQERFYLDLKKDGTLNKAGERKRKLRQKKVLK